MRSAFRKDGLIGMYMSLRESASTSDFPNLLANVLHKMLLDAFRGLPSPWRTYTKVSDDLVDFKTHDRAWLSEAEDLLEVTPKAPYQTTAFKDRKYQILLKTFGRTFQILRQTVINDDLNAFRAIPTRLGRAAARKIAKSVCERFETNSLAYDGTAIFADRSASANGQINFSSTALTADATGISAVQTGIAAIARSTDPDTGEIVGARAKYLLVSPARAENAKWIVAATQILRGSTDAPGQNPLRDPALAEPIEVLIEPFLTVFPNRWYLLADPNVFPAIETGFLNGQTEPELFQKAPDTVRIQGTGRDEFGYEFDDLSYKVRYDFAVATAMYQGAFKGGS